MRVCNKKVFTLKSKDRELCRFSCSTRTIIDPRTGFTHVVNDIKILSENRESSSLLPFEMQKLTDDALRNWLETRFSPVTINILALLENDSSLAFKLLKTNMLSLNDVWWVDYEGSGNTWASVNLYDNPCHDIIGRMVFSNEYDATSLEALRNHAIRSPEFTSKGAMRKRWLKRENAFYLIKEDEFLTNSPLNMVTAEWFAQQVGQRMGLTCIPYDLEMYRHGKTLKDSLVCSCRLFSSEKTGYIEAARIFRNIRQDRADGRNILLDALGRFYPDLLLFDAIIGNRDRHLENFGFLFDTDTCKLKSHAPIFDSGMSFNYMMDVTQTDIADLKSDSFNSFREQLVFCLRPHHAPILARLKGFTFREHPLANDATMLKSLETIVANQIAVAEELLPQALQLEKITPERVRKEPALLENLPFDMQTREHIEEAVAACRIIRYMDFDDLMALTAFRFRPMVAQAMRQRLE